MVIFGSRQSEKEREVMVNQSDGSFFLHLRSPRGQEFQLGEAFTIVCRFFLSLFCCIATQWRTATATKVSEERSRRCGWRSPPQLPERPGLEWFFRGCALQATGCRGLQLTGWTPSDGRVRCRFSSPWKCPPGRPTLSLLHPSRRPPHPGGVAGRGCWTLA